MYMKRATVLLLLLLCIPTLFASAVYHSVTVSAYPYFAIPHYKDQIPLRTTGGLSLSAGLFGLTFAPVDLSLEAHYRTIASSIPYGHYRLRGFHSFGATLRFSTPLSDSFSLFGAAGSEIHTYFQIEEAFVSFLAEAGVSLLLVDKEFGQLTVTFPLSVHLRKEITALSVGVGFRYQIYPYKRWRL